MVTFKSLSEFPLKEIYSLWNRAFEGYSVTISMSMDSFLARLVNEGLSLEHSFVCYVEGEQAGIVLHGFREADGKIMAWNGGTAVVPHFRDKKIGKAMMIHSLKLYEELKVRTASLEAISSNESAIRLYEGIGYELIDRLILLSNEQPLEIRGWSSQRYTLKRGLVIEASMLPFYQSGDVWQSQWQSLKQGESMILFDGQEAVGYALFKRVFDIDGNVTGISLYRCEVLPERADEESIIKTILLEVYEPGLICKRSAFNIRASNTVLNDVLRQLQFTVFMEQVLMKRFL